MIRLLALLIWLLPGIALAQGYPALFDVTGVASGDTLNIRAAPQASAEKIGEFGPNARDIEVIREEGGWGLVNSGERSGWASMRYLARQEGGDYALARHLICFGTEPFWSLDIVQGAMATLSSPDGAGASWNVGLVQGSANRTDRFAISGSGAQPLIAIVSAQSCNDGMSDREFGLAIDMMRGGDLYSGCCSLAAP